ncbi:MAG: tetratricopeptide repeat protein [Anaerolineales bacterium]|nr:MAG: tetratricopeptide repeat protein [Anaerolineales bacterium]
MSDEPKLTVFISSMIGELLKERQVVRQAINSIPLTRAWAFEYAPASADQLEESYLSKVRECDLFILLVGEDISEPVKREYETAIEHGKRCLVFVKRMGRGKARSRQAEEFVQGVGQKYKEFKNRPDLKRQVLKAVVGELVKGYRHFHLAEAEPDTLDKFRRRQEHLQFWANVSQIAGLFVAVAALIVAILAIPPVSEHLFPGLSPTAAPTIVTLPSAPAPLPTPVEPAFAPEAPDEALIIVIPFADEDNLGKSPEKRITRDLLKHIDSLGGRGEGLRVEQYTYPVKTQREAREIGRTYNATVVVWGWYDELGIQSFAEILKSAPIQRATGEELPLMLGDPDQVRFCLIVDLPTQATYLSFFATGLASFYAAEFEQAIGLFDLAVKAVPEGGECSTNVDEAMLYRGRANFMLGDDEAATQDFEALIAARPDSVDAHLALGILNESGWAYHGRVSGDFDKALTEFERVLELDEDNSVAYLHRGQMYCSMIWSARRGEAYFDLALSDLNRAIELSPDNPDAYLLRGILTQNLDDFHLAIKNYERLLAKEPNTYWLYSRLASTRVYYLAVSQLEANGYSWSIDNFQGRVSSDGPVDFKQLDLSQPMTEYTKAIELYPQNAHAYINRETLYAYLGKCELAQADFEIARSFDLLPSTLESLNERQPVVLAGCIAQETDK